MSFRCGPVTRAAALGLLALAALHANAPAQSPAPERPRPYPLIESAPFAHAVSQGTRTRTGRPGPRYWQQGAQYRLEATLDPAAARVTGRGTVRYVNNSPDTLSTVFFHLYQNLFAPEALRNEVVPLTKGMELSRVALGGRELAQVALRDPEPGYAKVATILRVRTPQPLPPGGAAEFEFAWAYDVPPDGAPRSGQDGETFVIAYWYPQVAVYDDVTQWQFDPYMGNAEFYMGYADYDVALTLPEGWLVDATGTLENAAAVLPAPVRTRLTQAQRSKDVVHVVTQADHDAGRATAKGSDGTLTWRFRARGVRDFTWAASNRYLWDAARALVGDADGDRRPDTAVVYALYRPDARNWDQSARYAQHSVEFLSRYLWPYPYPHMTVVDGMRSCGGMEYPMMTCIGGSRDTVDLYRVTVHEIGHMWFPMQVGSDEKRHSWQDEGLTRFNEAQAARDFYPGYDGESRSAERYLGWARAGGEVETMRHGDRFPLFTPAYGVATYEKTATVLVALRALLGEDVFLRAYREYGRRWTGRHPAPEDLFNTFADVSGRDLTWFWRTWMFETWTLDQALAGVRTVGDSLEIVVEDRGLAPMPARVAVTRAGGHVDRLEVSEQVWLAGARRHTLRVAHPETVTRVELDPEHAFPDTDRTNQVWTP